MEVIKTGIASFGMSGQVFHAPFIHTNPHFELSKIVERSKELSKDKYPYATIVRSVEEMLLDKDLELVVINTPDSTHYDYTKAALNAGKHVVVEKPFTATVKQAAELVALANEKGLMLSVYQNRRWDGDFLTVKKIIDNQLVGRLVEFESTFARYREYIKPGTWKETGEWGGGLTYNLGAHLIDQAVQLFGMPQAIYANIDILRTNGMVDDYFLIQLLSPQKCPHLKITLKSSYLMLEPEPRFVLHGTNGSYVKYGVDVQEAELLSGEMPERPHWGEENENQWGILHTQKDNSEIETKYPTLPGNYAAFYHNIYEHLRYGKALLSNAADNINIIRLIEAAYQSSRERKVISL